MICFECSKTGESRPAVALCCHCSAALCVEHAGAVDDPITATYPVCKTVVLPRHARLMLCEVCRVALEQTREHTVQVAGRVS